jgi:hypothetical protein
MATLNFPISPSNGDKYTFNNRTWVYNGSVWESGIVTSQTSPGGASLATLVVEDESGAKYELDKTKNSSISSGILSYNFNWWIRNDESTKTGLLTNKAVMELSEFFVPAEVNTSTYSIGSYSLTGYDQIRGIGTSDEYVYLAIGTSDGYDMSYPILHKNNMAITSQSLTNVTGSIPRYSSNSSYYRKTITTDDDYIYVYTNIDSYVDNINVFNKANPAQKITTISTNRTYYIDELLGDENSLILLSKDQNTNNTDLTIFDKQNNFSPTSINFDNYRSYRDMAFDDNYIYLVPDRPYQNYIGFHRYNRSQPITNISSYTEVLMPNLLDGAAYIDQQIAIDREFIYISGSDVSNSGGKLASFYKSNLALNKNINTDGYIGQIVDKQMIAYGGYLVGLIKDGYDLVTKVYNPDLEIIVNKTLENSAEDNFLTLDNSNIFTGKFDFYLTSGVSSYKWADTSEEYSTGYRMVGVSEPEPTE